ncbi:Ig-like domain-containing protein [Colwellia sp. RSH04]|uniref:Ig-like domain-containing protein n=1 Tax=Colwellia sp. RSH04 TaxID=2305464 RepID=UPI000E5828E0|nr:Ig-like domain-containing protein [Colwellia sp. RSH04]RHW77751.1 hypothetical protein D1094_02100 [Colwellia sp. RSH04]
MFKHVNLLCKSSFIALIFSGFLLSGCDTDSTNSAELARAVELERLRETGTIIETVTIHGGQTRLVATETHQLSATGVDSNGDTRDITNELVWTSSDESIAKVSTKGLVTAISNTTANQGIVTITGTTINDMFNDTEISVSDVAASAIELKQSSPESGNILTCIDASIDGNVTYEDGYTSLNTVRGMSFSVDEMTTASIDAQGNIFTSSEEVESTIVTAKIGEISDQLTVTADPSSLNTLTILRNEEKVDLISLEVGDRLSFNAQATLLAEISEEEFDIDNSVMWQSGNSTIYGLTAEGENKGTMLGLKPGITTLSALCGGKKVSATVNVSGDAELDELQINDGETNITISKNTTLDLTLLAKYTSESSSSLNVTEFTQWSLNGSELVSAELIEQGTGNSKYQLTTAKDATGTLIVSAIYDGDTVSVIITIE